MLGKHAQSLLRYSTPLKLVNLIACETEKALRIRKTRAMPYTATIDVTNACNLRCPYCPTGLKETGRPIQKMGIDTVSRFLDELGRFLYIAHLFNWGESLLHPQIAEIVELVHSRNVFTCISTNLNIENPNVLEAVCDAGLDHLYLSIDGATEASYREYRRGGDFDLVCRNIRHLVNYRMSKGSRTPILEWKYLVFAHNEHEISTASDLAAQLGVDFFTPAGAIGPTLANPTEHQFRRKQENFCGELWHNVALQADGGLSPCCKMFHGADDFGHYEATSVAALRQNSLYREARALFGSSEPGVTRPSHPCLKCPIVHARHHQGPSPFAGPDKMGISLEDPSRSTD